MPLSLRRLLQLSLSLIPALSPLSAHSLTLIKPATLGSQASDRCQKLHQRHAHRPPRASAIAGLSDWENGPATKHLKSHHEIDRNDILSRSASLEALSSLGGSELAVAPLEIAPSADPFALRIDPRDASAIRFEFASGKSKPFSVRLDQESPSGGTRPIELRRLARVAIQRGIPGAPPEDTLLLETLDGRLFVVTVAALLKSQRGHQEHMRKLHFASQAMEG